MSELANFAVNVAWQSSAIALAALIASFVRPRHGVLALALIATVAVPVAGLFEPPVSAAAAPGAPMIRPEVIAIPYLVFVIVSALLLVRAWLRVRRLRRTAVDLPPMEIADACRAALGAGDVPIRASNEITAPVTIGVFRPMILLPALPAETLPAVIGHELAHVRRRDGVMQAIAELVSVIAGFNPLVRLLRRRMDIAREMACDELVTTTLVPPREYAQALLAVAGRAIAPRYGIGIGHALELRLRNLREPRRTRSVVPAILIAATAFAFRMPLTFFATHPNFSGDWVLDARRTDFGATRPYQMTMHVDHHGDVLANDQLRLRDGRSLRVTWRVRTDGVERVVTNVVHTANGTARWNGETLAMELHGNDGYWERAAVRLSPDRRSLVCEGEIPQGTYRYVLNRKDAR